MQLKAGRYLRFSDKDQSVNSIERQDIQTNEWCERNAVEITATFKDEGHSARTFDRPEVKELFDFIKRNHKNMDYLVVADLSRFSRDMGPAITMVENIQIKYNVRIVSCTWGQIYDVNEANSKFMMGIEFGLANAANLTLISNTNGGIYAAKTGLKGKRTGNERGRYVGSRAPLGYRKIVIDKVCNIEVDETTAPLVRMIFKSYLSGIPVKSILAETRKAGYNAKGKMVIQKILSNPVYIGEQYAKAWKNNAGGMFRGSWEPIMDNMTYQQVQDKLKGNKAKGISLSDSYYLKGVAHCYCGRKLTAAPSKGKTKYYPYYKCNCSKHVNMNADQAHRQLNEVLKYLSIPDHLLDAIQEQSLNKLEASRQENKKLLSKYKMNLAEAQQNLRKVEEKFIADKIAADTYSRWHSQYRLDIMTLEHSIEDIGRDDQEIYLLVSNTMNRLTDIPLLFEKSNLLEKQSLLNMVFDNRLYILDKTYRTPYLMNIFSHNKLILNQKRLLIIDEKRDFAMKPLEGSTGGLLSNSLPNLLRIIQSIRVA